MRQKHSETKNITSEIYGFDKSLERSFNVIKKELPKETQDLIIEYDKVMARQSISKAARRIHVQALLNLSRLLQKDWRDVSKKDIEDIVFKIMETYADERGQETWSSFDLKKVLKIFVRWIKLGSRDHKEVGDPEETKHVKLKPVRDTLSREDLITESDLRRLLFACGENARDRAFIDCHLEAGTRPGEILNLQLKHVKFDKYGAILKVDGKTGTRNVRLIKSVPNLANWCNVHPFKDNPEAPLWIMIKTEKFGKPLTYAAASKMVKIRCEKAGITKRMNLKIFRHSEATNTAKFLTEAQLRKRHGWSSISRMPARYVHMVDADVENAIFEHHGIKEKETEEESKIQKCQICSMYNSAESSLCGKCGKPLDLRIAIAEEELMQNEKENQRKRMEEMELNLLQMREEIKVLRRSQKSDEKTIRMANTILYKNQDKILDLELKPRDSDYLLRDKQIEKNYNKIFEIDSHYFDLEKSETN